MLKSKYFIVAVALVVFVNAMGSGKGAAAEQEGESLILRKAQNVKRLMKHGLIPFRRHSVGLPKTGQTTSYAAGDDGDSQRGVPWPDVRFIDHGDGTVTDRVTGLMWTKDPQEIPIALDWYAAIKACNDFIFAGYDNWRMPNVLELLSLIDFGTYDPALPCNHPFTNVGPGEAYWSSTTALPHSAQAWHLDIMTAKLRRGNKASSACRVWPVRRGRQHIW